MWYTYIQMLAHMVTDCAKIIHSCTFILTAEGFIADSIAQCLYSIITYSIFLCILHNPVECKITMNWTLFSPERSHNVVRVLLCPKAKYELQPLLQPLNNDNIYNKHDERFRDCGWGKGFKGRECFKPINFFGTIPRASTVY